MGRNNTPRPSGLRALLGTEVARSNSPRVPPRARLFLPTDFLRILRSCVRKSTKEHGTGLGLATSFNALRHGGGHLALRPQVAGCGAIFEMILPATSAAPATMPEPARSSEMATLAKVLVMDDEKQVLRYIARSLEAIGCDVTCVDNGDAAVEVFEAHSRFIPFDVVILDMTVPDGHGGIWTLERLLRLDPYVKAVAISGYTIETTRDELLSHGFCEFIAKPMKPQVLWTTVRAAVG